MAKLDYPEVDLSMERSRPIGEFPREALQAGREKEIKNLIDFDAYEELYELPDYRTEVYDTTWRDEWRGDEVRSRLCVRQYKTEGKREYTFASTPDSWFLRHAVGEAAMDQERAILIVDISVAFMHARSDGYIIVKAPSGIKTAPYWRIKAVVNGTRKASQLWQEFSADNLNGLGFERHTYNPSFFFKGEFN